MKGNQRQGSPAYTISPDTLAGSNNGLAGRVNSDAPENGFGGVERAVNVAVFLAISRCGRINAGNRLRRSYMTETT